MGDQAFFYVQESFILWPDSLFLCVVFLINFMYDYINQL